ncbi:hypothetical protein PIB30_104646 [Stylosanthes scabra]|uniref:Uncharacterized protein n=1 Tax=Stylosanthes scabra TaxID=79078 RepID=A0ABU6WY02_9FABA|nr:hypothetical protein [Stylosanthes scabra]
MENIEGPQSCGSYGRSIAPVDINIKGLAIGVKGSDQHLITLRCFHINILRRSDGKRAVEPKAKCELAVPKKVELYWQGIVEDPLGAIDRLDVLLLSIVFSMRFSMVW